MVDTVVYTVKLGGIVSGLEKPRFLKNFFKVFRFLRFLRATACCSAYMLSSVRPSDGWIIEQEAKLSLG